MSPEVSSEDPSISGAPSSAGATPSLNPPERVGRYRIAFELAAGGMATVYLASAEGPAGFEKVVALKRIHRHLALEKKYVEMFLDEARLAARIVHPNVCGVLDFGESKGEHFIVMEYLVGEPLSRLVSAAAKRWTELDTKKWTAIACRLVIDACEGLHAAHELRDATGQLLNVVHRDVSPQNLFVGFDGTLRVVDFGIAKAADKISQTDTGSVKGKFAYMAPEQIMRGALDRRVDVWALGVVLWEALTVRRLFRRSNEAETMYAVLQHEIRPPSDFNPEARGPLDEILQKALARDPEERYPDARAFGRELSRALSRLTDEPTDALVVATLMADVFPGEETRKRQLMELARVSGQRVPKLHNGSEADSYSGVRVASDADGVATKAAKRIRPAGPNRSLVGAVVALVSTVVLLLGTLAVVVFGATSEPTTTATEARPTPPAGTTPPEVARPPTTPQEPVTELVEPPPPVDPQDDPPELAADPETQVAAVADPVGRTRPHGRPTSRPSGEPSAPVQSPPQEAPPPPSAPPVAAAEATPSTGNGTLVVVTPGAWANVYDETGHLLGATPLRASLAPGHHAIELRMLGQPPALRREIDVVSGQTARVSVRAD